MKRRLLFIEEKMNKHRKLIDENPIQNRENSDQSQLTNLPTDIYVEIFQYCHMKDLIRLAQINKSLNNTLKSYDRFKIIVDINKEIENLQPSTLSMFFVDHLKTSAVTTLMSTSVAVGAYTRGDLYGGIYGAAAFSLCGGYAALVSGIGFLSIAYSSPRYGLERAAIGSAVALSLPAYHIVKNIGIATSIVGVSACGLSLFGLLSHAKKIDKNRREIRQIKFQAKRSITARENY